MYRHLDSPLISAFIERWHPETSSFHLPFGEMTITLHDVYYLLRIPAYGTMVYHSVSRDDMMDLAVDTLGMDRSDVIDSFSRGARFYDLEHICTSDTVDIERRVRGYLLHLLGTTLFVDKTQDRVSFRILPLLTRLQDVRGYGWGAAALAYLYRQLGVASRAGCSQLGGCLTLLQVYFYFIM